MSLEDKKIKCVCCGAYLFDEDDVVFCPQCGAPHHRDCYNSLGHCALEDKHGTAEEYNFSENAAVIKPDTSNSDNTEKLKCPMCGNVYDLNETNCPSCGVPSPSKIGKTMFVYDYLGGVPADLDLGEGVTANEAKRFVFSNSQRYIPKFAANKTGKKASFNWLAFLFPCGWFLSRKMYKQGALVGALQVALQMLMLPFIYVASTFMPDGMTAYPEVYAAIAENMDKIGTAAIIAAFISVVAMLALRFVAGIFGDYFYRNHVIKTVGRLKATSADLEEDYRRYGGVNFFAFVLGVIAVEYLPQILYAFLI